jgi:hypothetical protein
MQPSQARPRQAKPSQGKSSQGKGSQAKARQAQANTIAFVERDFPRQRMPASNFTELEKHALASLNYRCLYHSAVPVHLHSIAPWPGAKLCRRHFD